MTSVLLGALLLSAIGCGGENPTAETQTDSTEPAETPYIYVPEEPKEGTMQIIPDITFRTGMQLISQKDHANGDAWDNIVVAFNSRKEPAKVSVPKGNYTIVCKDGKRS